MSINLLQRGTEQDTTPGGSILAAATGQHHHGLHWNGGDKYNVIGYIGKGAFAMVYKLSSKRDGEVYAVKEIDKAQFAKNGASAQKARKELDVIKNLRHVGKGSLTADPRLTPI
jgi:serine/threonine protein kinase